MHAQPKTWMGLEVIGEQGADEQVLQSDNWQSSTLYLWLWYYEWNWNKGFSSQPRPIVNHFHKIFCDIALIKFG